MTIRNGLTYEQWLQKVDDFVVNFCGLGADDLPDSVNRVDAFEAGKKPETVAKALIRNAKSF